jgi:glutathione S-transferase
MLLYDAPAPNPYVIRLFTLERKGLTLDVQSIDIMAMENRKPTYRNQVNPRGELPALRISDTFVLTEITAICEYLDEVAIGGISLFGITPLQRAETRMWLRRMDLEIAQPVLDYYRNDPATIDFYKGNRIPTPAAQINQKVTINKFLNLLDDELEGKTWLCGERFSAADVHFYGLMTMMREAVPWLNTHTRKNVAAYSSRMDQREASKKAMEAFGSSVSV